MGEHKGALHSIETFGSVDGPGIRYVIFLQGCAMRCQFCHNADTWQMRNGEAEAKDVLQRALRYRSYWRGGGGITVSGGEPLLQIDFLLELFEEAKKQGIHTVIDTCGQPFTREEPFFSKFKALMTNTDLVLLDIKHIDEEAHRALTGCSGAHARAFARYLSERGKPMWIRHVLVPGITDDDGALLRLKAFIDGLKTVEKVEVLPYHTLGITKYRALGMEYPLEGVRPPEKERVQNARMILSRGIGGKDGEH